MLLKAKDIHKSYKEGKYKLEVLRGVDYEMNQGSIVGIYGTSGSGKSTLLHILGGLDEPDKGSVLFDNSMLNKLNEKELANFRNKHLGFVFQFYYLLPEFSALENVMIPCLIAGNSKKQAKERAENALDEVGLKERFSHKPAELSGGEQQRVCLARAIVLQPKLVLADEPTGNLDRQTGNKIFDYLLKMNQKDKISMIIVSHNMELLKQLPKTLLLRDGKLHEN